MTPRDIKSLLVLGVAPFYSLIVFNNITDYGSNYQFVHHVLKMDDTFPGNHGMWRSIDSPLVYTAFYLSIIAWETITMLLCWWGGLRMAWARRETAAAFLIRAKGHSHRGADTQSADVADRVPLCGR